MAGTWLLFASLASAAGAPADFLSKESSMPREERMLNSDVGSRQARSKYHKSSLGPLAGLLGTWEGRKGMNIVRLPEVSDSGGDRTGDFSTLIQDYMETVTFTPILGAVLNRGYQDANHYDPSEGLNQTLLGVTYYSQVHKVDASGNKGDLLHVENGQWLLHKEPGITSDWSISRISLGGSTGRSSRTAVEQAQQSLPWPFGFPENTGNPPFFGYGELGADANPILRLQQDTGSVSRAQELRVSSSARGGGIVMLPNVKSQAFNEAFNATFWIEDMEDGGQQLQYVQTVFLDFEAKFSPECESSSAAASDAPSGLACLIKWAHYQANTLHRVDSLQAEPPQSEGGFPYIR